jgi:two-component system chemotaxis response regulator CheB
MSEIKVVKRFPKQGKVNVSRIHLPPSENLKVTDIQLVAIGASTGGPMVLQTILSNLPNDFPAPILIVQHIARGFVAGFRDWLATSSSLPVSVAVNGEKIKPGKVYIAPDEHQMGITKGPKINLCKLPAENGLCPSVSFLFRSVSEVMGSKAIGILLTGMGKDGASELKMMKNNGAITIAQDEASSVVYGMPGEAVKIGAATKVLPPAMIAAALSDLCNNQPL